MIDRRRCASATLEELFPYIWALEAAQNFYVLGTWAQDTTLSRVAYCVLYVASACISSLYSAFNNSALSVGGAMINMGYPMSCPMTTRARTLVVGIEFWISFSTSPRLRNTTSRSNRNALRAAIERPGNNLNDSRAASQSCRSRQDEARQVSSPAPLQILHDAC